MLDLLAPSAATAALYDHDRHAHADQEHTGENDPA
jgi:hypothetical protein